MSDAVTVVRISFFKPVGFEDIRYVNTIHRGKAVEFIMDQYPEDQQAYLNYVSATICDRQKHMKVEELPEEEKD